MSRESNREEIRRGGYLKPVNREGEERVVDFLQVCDAGTAFDRIDLRRYSGMRLAEVKASIIRARVAADDAYQALAEVIWP